MKEYQTPLNQYESTKDSNENWHLRADVAGYEYKETGCNWRIGVVRDIIEDETSFTAVKDILATPFTDAITRNMARVVITADLLNNPPPFIHDLLPDLEVLIDLRESGVDSFKDCYQAIFSRNASTRQTSAEQIAFELANAQKIFNFSSTPNRFSPNPRRFWTSYIFVQ